MQQQPQLNDADRESSIDLAVRHITRQYGWDAIAARSFMVHWFPTYVMLMDGRRSVSWRVHQLMILVGEVD